MSIQYEIKGIKNFKGHEGEPCSQGSLYCKGKKVCEWSDDAWGGPIRIRFSSNDNEADFGDFAKIYLEGKRNFSGEVFNLASMNRDDIIEQAISSMINIAIENNSLEKLCKKELVFSVPNDNEPSMPNILSCKVIYTENRVALLKKEHPELIEIINTRFGPPIKDGSKEHLDAELIQNKAKCKTHLMFVRVVDGVRVVYSLKNPYSPERSAALKAKHPDIVRILNEA